MSKGNNVEMKKVHGLTLTGVYKSKIKMFYKQRWWPSSLQQNYELSMF